MRRSKNVILVSIMGILFGVPIMTSATPMGTSFTYQGRLSDGGEAANGSYDFQFRLFGDEITSDEQTQIGDDLLLADVPVTDGYFTVELEFTDTSGVVEGGVFNGHNRWLEIGVRSGALADPNEYTLLSPRQQVTATPYALYAASGPGISVPLEMSGAVANPDAVISSTNTDSGFGVFGLHTPSSHYGILGGSDFGVTGVDDPGGNVGYLGTVDSGVHGSGEHGVFGINEFSGNYGYLGSSNEGVFGYADMGYAGYFQGDVMVTDNLSVYGRFIDSAANAGTPGQVLSSTGTGTLWTNLGGGGDITAVNAGTGLTGGGESGDVTLDLAVPLSLTGSVAHPGAVIHGINTGDGYGLIGENTGLGSGIRAYSAAGYGIQGSTNGGTAIYGINLNNGNVGQLGTNNYGVYGKHEASGNYGYIGGSEYAGYFSGGKNYFEGDVGIGTTNPAGKLDVHGKIKEYGNDLLPAGVIVMWSGDIAAIPAGWALCDGTNGTPDLRNRFIVGSGDAYTTGDTGGEEKHTLSTYEMPSHSHYFTTNSAGEHFHSYSDRYDDDWELGGPGPGIARDLEEHYESKYTSREGSHTHTGTTNSRGSDYAHENRPPYYALAYIMKQ